MPTTDDARLGRALFRPRSIALVGASDDPLSASYRPLAFLRKSGYAGEIYPINSNRHIVQGERAWKRIEDFPEVPEHAFVMTPASATIDIVRACGDRGVAVATILSGGFAESGAEGARRQEQLIAAGAEAGIR